MEPELQDLRKHLDTIDTQITALFVERMKIIEKIAREKETIGIPVLDIKREHEVLSHVSSLAGKEFAADTRVLYSIILEMSRARQQEILLEHHDPLNLNAEKKKPS